MNPLQTFNKALDFVKNKPTLEALVLLLAMYLMYDGWRRDGATADAHKMVRTVFERRDAAEEKRAKLLLFGITGKRYEDVKDEAKEAGVIHEESDE